MATWTRYGNARMKVGLRYTLDSRPDVAVWHCGHPTALRPYYVVIDGDPVGPVFRLLADAKAHALELISKED